MIARKQEIGLQLNQLIDALLLGGVFWICHLVSVKGLAGPASSAEVPGFTHFLWMLAVIVPFAPFFAGAQWLLQLSARREPAEVHEPDHTGGILAPDRAGAGLFSSSSGNSQFLCPDALRLRRAGDATADTLVNAAQASTSSPQLLMSSLAT